MDRVSKIIEETCKHYGITESQMMARSRKKEIVIPRHAAMKLIHDNTLLSLKSIGIEFGGKDHSTVIHAINNIDNMVFTDTIFKNYFNILEKNIKPLLANLPDKALGMWAGRPIPTK